MFNTEAHPLPVWGSRADAAGTGAARAHKQWRTVAGEHLLKQYPTIYADKVKAWREAEAVSR